MSLLPIVSAEDLASYLQRSDLDRSTADLAVAGASGTVRDYCGWAITLAEETLTVDGSGGRILLLPTLQLTAVPEVRVDGVVLAVGEFTWSVSGRLYRDVGWPRRYRAVEVDCTHGHDPAPDAVRVVALEVAARAYSNPERLSTKGVGNTSAGYDFRPVDMARLDPYRLP